MLDEREEAALTAYALGELEGEERAAVEALLARSEDARRELLEIQATAAALRGALASGASHRLTEAQRARVEAEAKGNAVRPRRFSPWLVGATVAAAASLLVAVFVPLSLRSRVPEEAAFMRAESVNAPTAVKERRPMAAPSAAPPLTTMPLPAQQRPAPPPPGPPPPPAGDQLKGYVGGVPGGVVGGVIGGLPDAPVSRAPTGPPTTEEYGSLRDNPFVFVAQDPRSTFSVDVDTAAYSIVRRFLTSGRLPPKDAVRIEELINYFTYSYAPPTDARPFAVHVESAACPWKPGHALVRIALKGREIPKGERPPSNLVFLLDVSGSMNQPNKLPLVQAAMRLLVGELHPRDRVAVVVYAGGEGLALPSTPATEKDAILSAIESLRAGGSTHASAGIQLAYEIAAANFIRGGVNRVILATDGDFNVGVTSSGELIRLIQEKAKTGVFLTTLGFGMDNLKDQTLEKLADNGNGNYAYIDTLFEARKVLVDQAGATLVTIAKDVKLQVEWNPAHVQAFRLIGYENRVLAHQDFADDKRDAGEIGAGHAVTALYEVVPPGVPLDARAADPLKYQRPAQPQQAASSNEWLTLKLRYKQPDGERSALMEVPFAGAMRDFSSTSADFRFAAAVAAFGMNLRDSPHKGDSDYDKVLAWAKGSLGSDEGSLRAELVTLVEKARALGAPPPR